MIKGLLKLFISLMAFTWLAKRILRRRIQQEEETEDVSSAPWHSWRPNQFYLKCSRSGRSSQPGSRSL